MAQVRPLDFKGFVERRSRERAGGTEHGGRSYAYISDRTTRSAFEQMKSVELAVTAAVRLFKAVGRTEMLGHAVKVSPRQFPRLYALAAECAKSLDVPTPQLYVKNHPVMNAMTYGTNDDSFIIVHSALIDHFTDEELLSVIGHETGHIHNNHVIYLTALALLTQMAGAFAQWIVAPAQLALSGWMRRAEITCDRAGLLCGKDVQASQRAFAKLALGSTKLYPELDLDVFMEQYEEAQQGVGRYAEMRESHPFLPKRMKALKAFSESQLYRKHAGLGDDGLTMEQVDEKVHEIIKIWG
ncbi:MAG TPA: M48 family metallopeptidase [Minicystis sp.]|nr:M48 family metallopeptidase [Minicystis sp.]